MFVGALGKKYNRKKKHTKLRMQQRAQCAHGMAWHGRSVLFCIFIYHFPILLCWLFGTMCCVRITHHSVIENVNKKKKKKSRKMNKERDVAQIYWQHRNCRGWPGLWSESTQYCLLIAIVRRYRMVSNICKTWQAKHRPSPIIIQSVLAESV